MLFWVIRDSIKHTFNVSVFIVSIVYICFEIEFSVPSL